MVQVHLEPLKEEPVLSFSLIQIVVEVPGREPEGVDLALGSHQQHSWGLLVVHARVVTYREEFDLILFCCHSELKHLFVPDSIAKLFSVIFHSDWTYTAT